MKSPILSCTNLSFSIGDQEILHDVSFSIFPSEVIALVGPNGVGKSTLLRLIASKPSKNVIAYFPQEIPTEYSHTIVREYVGNIRHDILGKLDLNESILEKKIGELSGGEKSKINLLKIGNIDADLFLLDEPTNNLDSKAIKYLENLIESNKKSAFIIISHDRQLMENFADRIIEIDWRTRDSVIYPGPFSTYMKLRKEKIEKEWQRYNEYLSQKDALRDSLQEKKQWSDEGEKGPKRTDGDKMSAGLLKDWSGKVLGKSVNSAKRKLEELEIVERPREMLSMSYPILMDDRSGDLVFEMNDVEMTRGTKNIGPVNIKIQFGDKFVILGDNGSGKTTIIKTLLGEIVPTRGQVRIGSRIKVGYLPQESELSEEAILSRIKEFVPEEETEFRKLLNNFGITKNEMKKGRNELSPGERSRFALASIIAQKPNCLILDEPTNHLDIFALDFLEEALRGYEGTVILVTHDRYFLNKIGDYKVLDLGKL